MSFTDHVSCTSLEKIEAVFGDQLAETIEEASERARKEKSGLDAEHKEVSSEVRCFRTVPRGKAEIPVKSKTQATGSCSAAFRLRPSLEAMSRAHSNRVHI